MNLVFRVVNLMLYLLNEEQILRVFGKASKLYNRKFIQRYLLESSVLEADSSSQKVIALASGPFAGMKYFGESSGSNLAPKIFGTYENQLNKKLGYICDRKFTRLINIGCGEGYFAVGLALRMPEAQVWAFDSNPKAQGLTQKLATLNHVGDRVFVKGLCEFSELRSLLSLPACLFMDCEGCESVLLDIDEVPELARTTILVELHDFIIANIEKELRRRFSKTHTVEVITQQLCWPENNGVKKLSELSVLSLIHESRPRQMSWMYLEPHHFL